MSDPQVAARFGVRIRTALSSAVSEAFGGVTEVSAPIPGELEALVEGLGEAHHLHLELEVATGRQDGQMLVMVLRPHDGERVFELEPTDPALLDDPSTQLRVLAEFTEAAEALSSALAGALAAGGTIVTVHVSGASLEAAEASPAAAVSPLAQDEIVSFGMTLNRPPGEPVDLVVATTAELATLLGAAPERHDTGGSAAERAANLAARVASRRAPIGDASPPPPAAAPAGPPITAHPFAFSQLEGGAAAATHHERGVDLILDVALNVRVELGSTHMTVEEVLGLSPGSVVELDRLAGEPVDIVINDRLLARGEVVVIEENFGVRVTEILSARSRAAVLG